MRECELEMKRGMSVREGEGGEGGRERREEGEECEREGVRHREEHRDRQTESSHCERVCKVHSREPARCTDVAAGARLLVHGCCCTAAAARLLLAAHPRPFSRTKSLASRRFGLRQTET